MLTTCITAYFTTTQSQFHTFVPFKYTYCSSECWLAMQINHELTLLCFVPRRWAANVSAHVHTTSHSSQYRCLLLRGGTVDVPPCDTAFLVIASFFLWFLPSRCSIYVYIHKYCINSTWTSSVSTIYCHKRQFNTLWSHSITTMASWHLSLHSVWRAYSLYITVIVSFTTIYSTPLTWKNKA